MEQQRQMRERSGASEGAGRGARVPQQPARPEEGPGRGGARQGRPGSTGTGRAPGRLTAVGAGVVSVGAAVLGAAVDAWLFGGPGILFGLVFLVTCFQVAIRVRPVDLAAAPISGPIAFAVALLLCGRHTQPGISGHLLGLVTDLALQAVWLFVGTGLAAVIVLARHLSLRRARRARAAR